jgi:hypothetical protein
MAQTACPICKVDGFVLECDEVDIGIGTIEGNFHGVCKRCGEIYQCSCGFWMSEHRYEHTCYDNDRVETVVD